MKEITRGRVTTFTLSGVETVRFERGYPYFEVVNMGDAPVYLSKFEDCTAGADGVYTVPAGGGRVARLDTSVIYLSGSGTVQVTAKYEAEPSFKSAAKGGVSKDYVDEAIDSNTPQLLFEGVTSEAAPAVVDLSGYGLMYIRVDRWDNDTLVDTQGYYDKSMIAEMLTNPDHNAITIAGSTSQKVIVSGTMDNLAIYNVSNRHTVIYGIRQRTVLKINTQPQDVTCAVGDTVTFSVNAQGDGLTYRWYYSNNNGTSWEVSGQAGNKTNTLTVEASKARMGMKFKCVIKDSSGNTVTSDVATLTEIS